MGLKMKINIGHRFTTGVFIVFYLGIGIFLKSFFEFDFFAFCETQPILSGNELMIASLLLIFIFPQIIIFDNLMAKHESLSERKKYIYGAMLILSSILILLSIVL